MKFWRIAFYSLACIPFFYVVPLLLFYFHAEGVLGYYPRPGLPDPKELEIYDDYAIVIWPTFFVWMYSLMAFMGLFTLYLIIHWKRIEWRPVCFCALGQLIGMVFTLSDMTYWFLD